MPRPDYAVWLDFRRTLDVEQAAAELEEEGMESLGYHAEYDITGESLDDFIENLFNRSVEIGVSGQTTEGENNKFASYGQTYFIQEAIPHLGVAQMNLRWFNWAVEQAEEMGYEPNFYIEGEGQGSSLNQAIDSLERNSEMGMELEENGETVRYSIQDLEEMLY